MKIIYIFILLIIVVLFFSGCSFTNSMVRNPKKKYKNPINELRLFEHENQCSFVGFEFIEDNKYAVYQILNLRVINIYIPENIEHDAIIAEGKYSKKNIEQIFLFYDYVHCSDNKIPRKYFDLNYPDFELDKLYNNVVVFDKYQNLYILKQRGGDLVWVKLKINYELDWKVRKKWKYQMYNLRYLYSVPIDIIFFPVRVCLTLLSKGPM